MVYSKTRTIEVLDRGTYKDYDYVVLSFGTHPCGYVRIPENERYPIGDLSIDEMFQKIRNS